MERPYKTDLRSPPSFKPEIVNNDCQLLQPRWYQQEASNSDQGCVVVEEQLLLEHRASSEDSKDLELTPNWEASFFIGQASRNGAFPDVFLGNAHYPFESHLLNKMAKGHLPASTKLRQMIQSSSRIIVCPGVYDGLSARIALQVGFDAMYMTGAGTTASRLGAADLGLAQLHDMRTNAEMIANLQSDGPPLIADMDTGYGGPMVIARAVQQYHLAGVAAFHIEDQVLQKRCGHLQGKEVVDVETFIQRIRACKAAARRLRSDIVIIARTDALQQRGYSECIERLRRARDEGADMGILEGAITKEQARQAVLDLSPWPLCWNSVENGVSPMITVDEAQDMGYRAILFSFAALASAYTAIQKTFEDLKDCGFTKNKVTPKTLFEVCGLSEDMAIDAAAGGTTFATGV